MNFLRIINIFFIAFLINVVAVKICPSQHKYIIPVEEHLKAIIEQRNHTYDYDEKEKYEYEFETELLRFLKKKESFKYTFSQLPMRIASASDGRFKIYTWDTILGGTWHRMAGIVQWVDALKNIHAKLLNDDSPAGADDITQYIWIGAIYSDVYPLYQRGP